MIDSNSFNLGCEKMFYVLAGLATAYARLTESPQHRPAAFSATQRTAGVTLRGSAESNQFPGRSVRHYVHIRDCRRSYGSLAA